MNFIFGIVILVFLFYGDPDIFDLARQIVFNYLSVILSAMNKV